MLFGYPNFSGRFSAEKNMAANLASQMFFGGFSAHKNSAANLAIGASLGSTSLAFTRVSNA